jgi:hypothetical protein
MSYPLALKIAGVGFFPSILVLAILDAKLNPNLPVPISKFCNLKQHQHL